MRNLTLLTDLYQLTMMYGYSKNKQMNEVAVFDVFYRGVGNNYAIACGLEQVVDYVLGLKFEDEDIEYLRSLNTFDEEFFDSSQKFQIYGRYICGSRRYCNISARAYSYRKGEDVRSAVY